jgi:tetratricopeptide (TPR) repeat protein
MLRNEYFLSSTFLSLLILSTSTVADVPEESSAIVAEQGGKYKEALSQYMLALSKAVSSTEDDRRIRESILKLVMKMSPQPSLPEEAERRLMRGRSYAKLAQDKEGYSRAANEFRDAIGLAPWYTDGYFNLAVVSEKSGNYSEATRNLKLYLVATTNEKEVRQAKELLYDIEVKEEEAKRVAIIHNQKEDKLKFINSLTGTWQTNLQNGTGQRYEGSINGNSFSLIMSSYYNSSYGWIAVAGTRQGTTNFRGTIDGLAINGTCEIDWTRQFRNGQLFTKQFQGTISPDGKTIHLEWTGVGVTGAVGDIANGWRDDPNISMNLQR